MTAGQELVLLCGPQRNLCAFPLAHIREIMRPLPVRPLAGVPDFVMGVSMIRGDPVPVADLGALLGAPSDAAPARFITVNTGARSVALAVEVVLGVHTVPTGMLQELPPLLEPASGLSAIGRLDDQLFLVLEAARIVPEELWRAIESGMAP